MSRTEVIVCDGRHPDGAPSVRADDGDADDWVSLPASSAADDGAGRGPDDDRRVDLCPDCHRDLLDWADGRSRGRQFDVKHEYVTVPDLPERAVVSPGAAGDRPGGDGTHSFAVGPASDALARGAPALGAVRAAARAPQTRTPAGDGPGPWAPDGDPPAPESLESWHVRCRDHAGLTVVGAHKRRPLAVLQPGEHETAYAALESGTGHRFDTLYVEEDVDVERVPRPEGAEE